LQIVAHSILFRPENGSIHVAERTAVGRLEWGVMVLAVEV
jgi:hypothetical protein